MSRRGSILALVAVSMLGVMGVMAFAIEVGSLERERRNAQTAADAGAVAGANEVFRGRNDLVTASANTETARNGFTNAAAGVDVTVSHGPVSGYYVGNSEFVQVVVSRNVPAFFGNLLGRSASVVRAGAVAGTGAPSDNCLFTLHPDAEKALNVSGSTTRLDVNCGAVVNSRHSTKAVLIESSGTLTADNLAVVGGIDESGGNIDVSGSQQSRVPPSPNPLAYLQMPSFNLTQCDYTNTKVSSGTTRTLSPGIYCGGMEIDGTVTLQAGLYILRGGGLKMGSGRMTGTAVTFINTNATVANGGADGFKKFEMGSASYANLSAMTTGSLAGILFYQDPAAGKPGDVYLNTIGSGSNSVFTGTMYFPTQPVEIGSGSTATINGGLVATTLLVSSGSRVTMTGPGGGAGSVYFPFKRVSLVE